jgi:hypothetical protein
MSAVDVDTAEGVAADHVATTSSRSAPHHADQETDHDAEDLIACVQRVRQSTDPDTLWTQADDVQLPGFGSRYEDCGDEFDAFCEGCGAVKTIGRTCRKNQCPRCAPMWAVELGTRVTAKLLALRAYRDSFHETHQRCHHVVLSPPVDFNPDTDKPRHKVIQVLKELMAETGLQGWYCYHPFRGKDGDDRGEWAERLFDDRGWAEIAPELIWQPHIHAIVVGHMTPGGNVTKRLEEETGWVLHRITKEDSSVSIYGKWDLARAVTYCLSHAGTYDVGEHRRVCADYFGDDWMQEITVSERQEAKVNHVVRAVAPKTLGLPFNRLACSEEHDVGPDGSVEAKAHDHVVDLDRAQGMAKYWSLDSYASSLDDRDGGEDLWESGGGANSAEEPHPQREPDPSLTEADDETQRCSGRLLPISKAAPYLTSAEWCARAEYAEDTREAHQEWVDEEPWIPAVGDASDAQVQTVEFILGTDPEAGPDAPPPD